MIDVELTGSESPAEIVKAAVDDFSRHPHAADFTVFYENSIPKLKYEFKGGDVEFSCVYRLDQMLSSFYSDAERIFDEASDAGIVEAALREFLVAHIAFVGMSNMLNRLLILQAQIFLDNAEEARVTASGIFLHSLVAINKNPNKASLSRAASKTVQRWIDKAVADSMKKKRDFLVGFMNTQPLMRIPTSAGRPLGSTKSEGKKAKDKAEFEQQIEDAIRELFSKNGKRPSKSDVARFLKPGVNPKTGTDSRLSVFTKKCKHWEVDFDAIVTRVCGVGK